MNNSQYKLSALNNRLLWIDYMKTIGMYLIVLGHLFSYGEKFVYVFSVPLFFIISGFLNKDDSEDFFKKLLYNLIVPLFIISSIYYLIQNLATLSWDRLTFVGLFRFIIRLLTGMWAGGVETMWFVYTLILIKLVNRIIENTYFRIVFAAVMLLFAYLKNTFNPTLVFLVKPNAIVNLFLAYPCYLCGALLKPYRERLNHRKSLLETLIISTLMMAIIFLCGYYNGHVWMVACNYGGSFFLFFLGATSGTSYIYILCLYFSFFHKITMYNNINIIISRGSILVLGFHILLIKLYRQIIPQISLLDFFVAILILLVFVPVIVLTETYFPLMLGKYRKI